MYVQARKCYGRVPMFKCLTGLLTFGEANELARKIRDESLGRSFRSLERVVDRSNRR
jgi:hypothetical protein